MFRRRVTRLVTGFASFTLLVIGIDACSSKDDEHPHTGGAHTSPYPACDEIIKRCHPLDVGVGKISECHVFAHEATSDAECVAKRAECFATCVPAEDAGSDAGSATDSSSD